MTGKSRKKTVVKILLWLLVLGWMAVIFGFSSQNSDESDQTSGRVIELAVKIIVPDYEEMTPDRQAEIIEQYSFIVRKCAHFTEYAVLGLLIYGLLLQYRLSGRIRFWASVLWASAYAVSDEIHQMFVGGRSPQIMDVGIDSAGAFTGVFALWLILFLWKRKTAVKNNNTGKLIWKG